MIFTKKGPCVALTRRAVARADRTEVLTTLFTAFWSLVLILSAFQESVTPPRVRLLTWRGRGDPTRKPTGHIHFGFCVILLGLRQTPCARD